MSKSELLEVYLERSSIQEKRMFVCSLCPYRTDRRNNLKRHTATMHEQSTAVLECCGSRFANKAALRHHTAAYHRHGYICTICARVFCRRALLRRHHAVHSGYKEFTCNLCDYATSHKSNLERHMKIHESGEKYSSSSPSSTGQSVQHERNSSPEVDFFHPEDSNQSYRTLLPQSRDHNPILASLLSQPAHDGEVIQWIYHSPYDSYSSQVLNPTVVGGGGGGGISTPLVEGGPSPIQQHPIRLERRWSYSSFNEESSLYGSSADACGIARLESSSQTVPRETSLSTTTTTTTSTTLPLRHAIDVILGVKEELPKPNFQSGYLYNCGGGGTDPSVVVGSGSCLVTTASNHWSVGHLSSPGQPTDESPNFSDSINTSHSSHDPTSDMDSACDYHQHYYHQPISHAKDLSLRQKRPWQSVAATYNNSSETRENQMTTSTVPSSEEDIADYVPKKLRMSKRYQSN